MSDARPKDRDLAEVSGLQPDSEEPAHIAYVEDKIRRGREDFEDDRVIGEHDLWKKLGIEN
jgi:hypothetical protein